MFTITISADNGKKAIQELLDAASFYRGHPEVANAPEQGTPSEPAPETAKAEVKRGRPAKKDAPPVEPPKEEPKEEPKAEAPPADPPEAVELSLEDLRAHLTTFLSDPAKAPLVTAEIKQYGGKLSLVPSNKRQELKDRIDEVCK